MCEVIELSKNLSVDIMWLALNLTRLKPVLISRDSYKITYLERFMNESNDHSFSYMYIRLHHGFIIMLKLEVIKIEVVRYQHGQIKKI